MFRTGQPKYTRLVLGLALASALGVATAGCGGGGGSSTSSGITVTGFAEEGTTGTFILGAPATFTPTNGSATSEGTTDGTTGAFTATNLSPNETGVFTFVATDGKWTSPVVTIPAAAGSLGDLNCANPAVPPPPP